MKIELWCTTQTLLDEIADKNLHKKDIAQTYRLAMESSDETDWKKSIRLLLIGGVCQH